MHLALKEALARMVSLGYLEQLVQRGKQVPRDHQVLRVQLGHQAFPVKQVEPAILEELDKLVYPELEDKQVNTTDFLLFFFFVFSIIIIIILGFSKN